MRPGGGLGLLVLLASLATASVAHAQTIRVTTRFDVVGADGKCSLREAITAANTDARSAPRAGECPAGHGADVILLSAGRYVLSIRGAAENSNLSGDLDARSDVTLRGAGPRRTTTDAGRLDRVLDVVSVDAHVRLQGLTLTGGRAPRGGPGANGSPGGNGTGSGGGGGDSHGQIGGSGEDGGGIRNTGSLAVIDCVITGNQAGSGGRGGDGAAAGAGNPGLFGGTSTGGSGGNGGRGGGIASTGTLTLTDSVVSNNSAGAGGRGGDAATGGDGGTSTDPSISGGIGGDSVGGFGGNGGYGGGVDASGHLTIVRSTIAHNGSGPGGPGGLGGTGGHGGNGADGGNSQAGSRGGQGGQSFGGFGGTGGVGGGIRVGAVVSIAGSAILDNRAGAGGAAGGAGTGGAAGTGGDGSVGGAGGTGGVSQGGVGGIGGSGAGIYSNEAISIRNTTLAGNHAGAGGRPSPAGTGGGGGAGGASSGIAAGGIGGAGGDSRGGRGGPGGFGGGVAAPEKTLVNVTLSANAAGPGSAGAAAGLGGPGGAGGRSFIEGGSGGVGGDSIGGPGGEGGYAGATDGGTLLQVTVVQNSAGGGAHGGAPGAPASGGAGGRGTGGGTNGQHGAEGSAMAGDPGVDGFGGGTTGATTLTNSLFVGNTPSNCSGLPKDGGHNVSFPSASCPGQVVDPRLGPLQDNGGPAATLALRAGSPALNAIPAAGAGCPKTDERGVARPEQGACDIGAYENLPPAVLTRRPGRVSATSAVLRGMVRPNAHAVVSLVVMSAGARPRTALRRTVTGFAGLAVHVRVAGLAPGRSYRYRIVLKRVDGTVEGATQTFTTRRR